MRPSLSARTRPVFAAFGLSCLALVLAYTCLAPARAAQLPPGSTQRPASPGSDRTRQEAEVPLVVSLGFQAAWEGPYVENKPIIFHWDLKNPTPIPASGGFTVAVDDRATSATGLPYIQNLGKGGERTGDFTLPGLAAGTHTIVLQFQVPTTVGNVFVHKTVGRASLDISVVPAPPQPIDLDADGLDDNFERALLEHYRPYFKFSKPGLVERAQGEPEWDPYPPLDIADYLRHSQAGWAHGVKMTLFELLLGRDVFQAGQFGRLLTMNTNSDDTCTNDSCLSNLIVNKRKAKYAIEAVDLPDAKASMDGEVAMRNIGLYGHVVPYDPNSSQSQAQKYFRDTDTLARDGGPKRFVKIEYWQFFPMNGGPAPHGGDWDTVQALIDFGLRDLPCQKATSKFGQISSVFHYHHGDESRFDFRSCQSGPIATGEANVVRYRTKGDQVQLLKDDNGDFSHPVVYIEYATHEFWPGSDGSTAGAPGHPGDGVSFLTATPPNLGEVEAPLNEYPNAAVLMRFNGFWGRCCVANQPPPGPGLHTEWTYPPSSSIRWLLNGQVER